MVAPMIKRRLFMHKAKLFLVIILSTVFSFNSFGDSVNEIPKCPVEIPTDKINNFDLDYGLDTIPTEGSIHIIPLHPWKKPAQPIITGQQAAKASKRAMPTIWQMQEAYWVPDGSNKILVVLRATDFNEKVFNEEKLISIYDIEKQKWEDIVELEKDKPYRLKIQNYENGIVYAKKEYPWVPKDNRLVSAIPDKEVIITESGMSDITGNTEAMNGKNNISRLQLEQTSLRNIDIKKIEIPDSGEPFAVFPRSSIILYEFNAYDEDFYGIYNYAKKTKIIRFKKEIDKKYNGRIKRIVSISPDRRKLLFDYEYDYKYEPDFGYIEFKSQLY